MIGKAFSNHFKSFLGVWNTPVHKGNTARMEALTIAQMPLKAIKRFPGNPRRNVDAVPGVVASIGEFGWKQPIVVDAEMVIIIGDTRYLAAQELGHNEVPVHVATDLSATQVTALRIADNRTGEHSEWDDVRLALQLSDLKAADYDLSMTGFDELELAQLLRDEGNESGNDWEGMPEFAHVDKTAFRSIVMHFHDQEGVDAFTAAIEKPVTDSTRYIWYPEIKIERTAKSDYYDAAVESES